MSVWQKYIVNGFFGWENFKWFVREVQATFSNKTSHFSRKRIESFLLFINATAILDIWTYKKMDDISWEAMLAIYGAQMVYAGYQIVQIRKDIVDSVKKEDQKQSDEVPN